MISKKHIVIGIKENFRQSRNSMEIGLDHVTVKAWQTICRHNGFMADNMKLRVIRVQPGGHGRIGNNEDISDPWRVFFHRPQRIHQFFIIPEPTDADVLIHRVLVSFGEPCFIAAVHIEVYQINTVIVFADIIAVLTNTVSLSTDSD